jgi:uracil-DNA glycosylase
MSFPRFIQQALDKVDPSWIPVLEQGLQAMNMQDAQYLSSLQESSFLPTENRLFSAFSIPLSDVQYVLVGEGPYPREDSATGYCFMDGAVDRLWSDQLGAGLSKPVNKATSLRNFMKMLLVASGKLGVNNTTIEKMAEIAAIAREPNSSYIKTMAEMQNKLTQRGFLLLNAAFVFRPDIAPVKDARAWEPLLTEVFSALQKQNDVKKSSPATLILWGKIADQLKRIPVVEKMPKISCEHPYNLSFIANTQMHALFAPMHLLMR